MTTRKERAAFKRAEYERIKPAFLQLPLRLSIEHRDLADTLCFLERHARPLDQPACDECVHFAASMFVALGARLSDREDR